MSRTTKKMIYVQEHKCKIIHFFFFFKNGTSKKNALSGCVCVCVCVCACEGGVAVVLLILILNVVLLKLEVLAGNCQISVHGN